MNMHDLIGVNTHLDYTDPSPYFDFAKTIGAIKYLGVKHLRDCAAHPDSFKTWVKVRDATGVKFCAYLPEGSQATVHTAFTYWPMIYRNGLVDMFEGPNEDDDAYAITNGNNLAAAVEFTKSVASPYVHPLAKPLINVSVGAGWTSANGWQGDYDKIPDMTAYCTCGNAHVYPNPGQEVLATTGRIMGLAEMSMHGKPVIVTELGWALNQGHTEDQIAADIVKLAKSGLCGRFYLYALFDDKSGKFGLFNDDGTPRAGAKAIHDLLAGVV